MATFMLRSARSARSALRSKDLAARCLPASVSTSWPVTPLSQRLGTVTRLFSYKVILSEEVLKKREALQVTDDIVNSEAKLHNLYLKWLSYNDHHFDVEDAKAFKERFELFKETARFVNEWNKSGQSSTCTLSYYADMTMEEKRLNKWKTYPKKANQVMAGIAV